MYVICVTNAEPELDVRGAEHVTYAGWTALKGAAMGLPFRFVRVDVDSMQEQERVYKQAERDVFDPHAFRVVRRSIAAIPVRA